MITYRSALKEAQKRLVLADKSEQSALLYLLELSNANAHDLYMAYEEEMPAQLYEQYVNGIARLVKGEPLQHILGFEWFYGRRFIVSPHVLIPRPETEELVANVLGEIDRLFPESNELTLIDVGTGSGAIAISLKGEEERLRVLASDISEDAVQVAKENAANNNVEVTFLVGDMLEPFLFLSNQVDVLVSNPPYIKQDEVLESTVVDFEPHVALFGGADGLKFYRQIFEKAPLLLKPKAIMAFEMGYDQGEALPALAKQYFPTAHIEVRQDLSGLDRMLFIFLEG
ncbi:MAG: peptide chain release factor N(5)-glutamine methyltransferase [Erysipelotrichaceae bacterium]